MARALRPARLREETLPEPTASSPSPAPGAGPDSPPPGPIQPPAPLCPDHLVTHDPARLHPGYQKFTVRCGGKGLARLRKTDSRVPVSGRGPGALALQGRKGSCDSSTSLSPKHTALGSHSPAPTLILVAKMPNKNCNKSKCFPSPKGLRQDPPHSKRTHFSYRDQRHTGHPAPPATFKNEENHRQRSAST